MPDRPTDKRPYLAEPNYYRLVYQLAAQRMHAYLSTLAGPPGGGGQAAAVGGSPAEPAAGVATASAAAAQQAHVDGLELRKKALHDGERLLKEAGSMEQWFRLRAQQNWYVRNRRLRPGERRLRLFLSETLLPSAELLVAGIKVHEGKRDEAEKLAGPIREQVRAAKLSYRAAYNLACYEAAAAVAAPTERSESSPSPAQTELDTEHLDAGLRALREALSGVHGRRRLDLGRWARKDPALAGLRDCWQACPRKHPDQPQPISQATGESAGEHSSEYGQTYAQRFEKLLDDYGITVPTAPAALAAATPAAPAMTHGPAGPGVATAPSASGATQASAGVGTAAAPSASATPESG